MCTTYCPQRPEVNVRFHGTGTTVVPYYVGPGNITQFLGESVKYSYLLSHLFTFYYTLKKQLFFSLKISYIYPMCFDHAHLPLPPPTVTIFSHPS